MVFWGMQAQFLYYEAISEGRRISALAVNFVYQMGFRVKTMFVCFLKQLESFLGFLYKVGVDLYPVE